MNKEGKTYEQLLIRIREYPPVYNDSDGMTRAIMKRIEKLPRLQIMRHRRLYIAGWISTVAASLLICFMIGDTFFYPEQQSRKAPTRMINASSRMQRQVEILFPELTLSEKNKLFSPIIENRKEIQLKRERMRAMIMLNAND